MKNIILIICLGLALFLTACERQINIGCISPEGAVEVQTIDFASFNKIKVGHSAEVLITEGPVQSVEVEAAPNIINRLIDDSNVSNDRLNLEINGCSRMDNGDLIVRITIPSLEGLDVSGDGSFTTVGTFENVTDLDIDISGDGEIVLSLGDINMLTGKISGDGFFDCIGTADIVDVVITGDGELALSEFPSRIVRVAAIGDANCFLNVTEQLQIDIKGDGEIEAIGTAALQELEISGNGKVENFGLDAVVTNIDLLGDGYCEVTVSETLNVDVSGNGEVCYRGNPTVNTEVLGNGKVNDCN